MKAATSAALALVPALLAAAAPAAPAPRAAGSLQVFAAASLADAFAELGRRFEATHPGLSVRFNFAGSQQLAAQIGQGAAADVFASADERWMRAVEARGQLASEARIFARNELVVILPRTNPGRVRGLADLARGGLRLVLGADAVPVGRYARTALHHLSGHGGLGADYAARVLRNVVSDEENVKSVVGKVQLAEADAGIVYRSDVTPAVARFVTVLAIPAGANVAAAYPIALVQGGGQPDAAREFVTLVLSPEGQGVLANRGLLPAAGR